MPSSYTPVATKHATVTIPSDGDAHAATTYAPGYQQCADRTEHLYTREIPAMLQQFAIANHTAQSPGTATTYDFTNATYANGNAFVILSNYGQIESSSDMVTWTTRYPSGGTTTNLRLQGVAYGAGVYVAVGGQLSQAPGTGVRVYSAPDLSTWALRMNSGADMFTAVAFAAGLFVAVGDGGKIFTSPDGSTWTARTAGSGYTGNFKSIAHNGTLFISVGDSGAIQTSPDGITWTARSASGGYTGSFADVVCGDGKAVATGASGAIQTSTDGIVWTARTAPDSFAGAYTGLTWTGKIFVAVAYGGVIHVSVDGITWTSLTSVAYTVNLSSVTAAGKFVVMGTWNGSIRRSLQFL